MKSIRLILLLFFMIANIAQADIQLIADVDDLNMESPLSAHYALEENIDDSSGNGHHGIAIGNLKYASGKVGTGALFDGVDDYIDLPVGEHVPQTIIAWIKPDASAGNGFMTVLDSDRCYYYGQGIEISYPNRKSQYFQIDTHNYFYETDKLVEWDEWQQVAAVYTEGKTIFYHNGDVVKSIEYTQQALDGQNYTIGSHCSPDGGNFKGVIDEVSIYNEALSSAKINDLFRQIDQDVNIFEDPEDNGNDVSECTPDSLELCSSSTTCVLEGLGNWCEGSCTDDPCDYSNARKECAEFNAFTGKIDVNCLIIDGKPMSAQLSVHSYDPLMVELVSIGESFTAEVNQDCAEFDWESLMLYLPCLSVGGQGYRVDLILHSMEPILFTVKGISELGALSEMVYKDFYVNENSNEPLVASFSDVNNRFYAIFGIKDSENLPVYYHRLETYEMDSSGNLHDYLAIDFDSTGRPTGFELSESKGKMKIDYSSNTFAEVTIFSGGKSEVIRVDNPFSEVEIYLAQRSQTKKMRLMRSRPYEKYNEITYVGDIISCSKDLPKVSVQRNFDLALRKRYPLLAEPMEARVYENEYEEGIDYGYNYKISIPGDDFDAWARWCKAGYFFNSSLGFLGAWKDGADALAAGVWSIFKDIKAGTISNTARTVQDITADKITRGIPIISIPRNIKDAWDVEGAGVNGPCSKSAYIFRRKRLLQEQTITVDDGSDIILKHTYQPTAIWESGSDFVQVALPFDFSEISNLCEEPVDNDTVTCDSAVVKKIYNREDCRENGGAWSSGGLHYSDLGYCFCW